VDGLSRIRSVAGSTAALAEVDREWRSSQRRGGWRWEQSQRSPGPVGLCPPAAADQGTGREFGGGGVLLEGRSDALHQARGDPGSAPAGGAGRPSGQGTCPAGPLWRSAYPLPPTKQLLVARHGAGGEGARGALPGVRQGASASRGGESGAPQPAAGRRGHVGGTWTLQGTFQ